MIGSLLFVVRTAWAHFYGGKSPVSPNSGNDIVEHQGCLSRGVL